MGWGRGGGGYTVKGKEQEYGRRLQMLALTDTLIKENSYK